MSFILYGYSALFFVLLILSDDQTLNGHGAGGNPGKKSIAEKGTHMKREEIKAIIPEITPEQLDSIMGINGSDIEKAKAKVTALEAELKDKKEAFDNLNTEFNTLKAQNASGEDWKAKFEALYADNLAKEKQAEADRIAKEKADSITSRFTAVLGEKQFSHDAIKADYLKKFGEALDNKDNAAKSDADIFHELTKDDTAAFKGITTVKLAGGTDKGFTNDSDEAQIRAVMGLPPTKN